MTIPLIRDIVIILLGIVATGALVFLTILAYSLYKRLKDILNSLDAASSALQNLASSITSPLSQPLNQVSSLVQGVREGIEGIVKMFQKGNQE